MKKFIGFIFFSFSMSLPVIAQQDTILQRIVLVGDAGALTEGKHPVAEAIRKFIKLDKKTSIIYLGDNLYKAGLPDDQSIYYSDGKKILDAQLSVADSTDARVFMIPGNHDWENGGRGGHEAIVRQQQYVDLLFGRENVFFYPKDGCPGPEEIDLGDSVTLVVFDSQWWIHPHEKPGIESDCDCKTTDELVTRLEEIVSRNAKKLVILACHHPFKTNSVHGGFFTLKQHIFPFTDARKNLYVPLPVIGSIYPIARSVFGSPQDLSHPAYTNMINQVTTAVKSHANVVFASGHDHGLQLIKDSNYHYIVSGGGCKTNRVSASKKSLFTDQTTGFAVMEVSKNKNVTVSFYTVTDSIRHPFTTTIINFSNIPEPTLDSNKRVVDIPNAKFKDTVTISASDKYPSVKGLKKYVVGENYRKEWSTPVNMKVFNLKEDGYRILSLGGGKQTKSLRLKDKKGKEWVLRAIDKNPTKALPEDFRNTLAQDLVQEFNSAAHPYAPLTIPALAEPLNIAVPHPQLYFVPDDPSFGFYQPLFANTVCMLEERDPSIDGSETRSTIKVFNKLIEENDHRADQEAVLRARLLDILIGDFDRHFDQWRWATSDTGKGKLYYPIPRDRDQAYFYSDGKLLKYASRNLLPFLAGFRYDIPKVNWLGFSAKDFDRLFLTDLDAKAWKKSIEVVQTRLSDTVIANAIKKLPKEVYGINGKVITDKLISRRNLLSKEAMEYYEYISRQVNVVGSNEKEYFRVTSDSNGLNVRVYARESGNDTSFTMYNRTFQATVTDEIRLYGLNGDDLFEIDEKANSKIKLRLVGGKGNDTFNVRGNVRNLLYDMNVEGNYVKNTSRTKNRFSKDPPVNSYSILGFKYHKSRFPSIEIGANSDDGFVIGAGFSRETHGFRNEPYATKQAFSAMYSISRNAYRFRYDGEFNHFSRDFDMVIKTDFGYPGIINFFGLGNETEKDEDLSYDYYRSRFRLLTVQSLVRRRMGIMHLMAGPYFEHYWNYHEDNVGKILEDPDKIGLDSADIYTKKSWLGPKLVMKLDNRNNEVFPTRGILWNNEFTAAFGMNDSSENYYKLTTDMTIYASLTDPAKIIAVVGLGGGKIFNNDFEYYQAMSLGNTINLHGFRKNRYAGRSSLYGSLELRMKLVDIKSYFLPGQFGITGFYDIGRVWLKGEDSRKWHSAYGGGLYFIPFNLFVITASAGFSSGEHLFNFTFGTKVNLRF
jgi:hypothetical protein